MPLFGNAYAYAVAQSDPALSVERGFDDTWVEASTDLRTAAVVLLDVISPMLGEHELRQLVPIAWKLLLHNDEATVRVAGHLITLCAHVTPQYAQRAILGDLYRCAGARVRARRRARTRAHTARVQRGSCRAARCCAGAVRVVAASSESEVRACVCVCVCCVAGDGCERSHRRRCAALCSA